MALALDRDPTLQDIQTFCKSCTHIRSNPLLMTTSCRVMPPTRQKDHVQQGVCSSSQQGVQIGIMMRNQLGVIFIPNDLIF